MLGTALAGAWAKIPGSARVTGAATRAGTFLGTTVGKAFSVALLAAAVIGLIEVANAIEDEAARQQGGIAGSISDEIVKGNLEGLKQSKAALEQGIRDLRANSAINILLPTFTQEQVDALQAQLDRVNAKIAASLRSDVPHQAAVELGQSVADGVAQGVTDGQPGVGSALAYYGNGIKAFGISTAKLAREAGNRAGAGIAQGIHDARQKPLDAFNNLVEMLKHPLTKTAEIARLLGELTGKELVKGLKSGDPEIRAQALAVKQSIIDRLGEIQPTAGAISKASAKAVAEGLKSKDPDIRAAAQHIQDIIDGKFTAEVPKAKTAGEDVGRSFLSGLTRIVSSGVVKGPHVMTYAGKLVPLAEGGPYQPNVPRLVGERGPELDFPRVGGMVVSNAEILRALGSASSTFGGGVSAKPKDEIHYHLEVQGSLVAKDEGSVLQTLQRLSAVAE